MQSSRRQYLEYNQPFDAELLNLYPPDEVTIGQPTPHPETRVSGYIVPCEIEILRESNINIPSKSQIMSQ